MFAKIFFSEQVDGKTEGHTSEPWNQMHKDYFKEFNPEEKSVKKVIRAARGASKTTFFALIDVLHRVCYATEPYILILSSTAPLARFKGSDIFTEVIQNNLLQQIYGLTIQSRRASKERFEVRSIFGVTLIQSQGFFSQIRGVKQRHHRPSRIIYDDVTHGERVFSEVQREKADRQFKTDIIRAAQPKTNHIIVGTTIHEFDLPTQMSKLAGWKSYLYPAIIKWPDNMDLWAEWESIFKDASIDINERPERARTFYMEHKKEMDAGAQVLWPEKEDLYYLMDERRMYGHRSFEAEKQMKPFLTGENLFSNKLWFTSKEEGNETYYVLTDDNDKEVERIKYSHTRFQNFYALDPATGEINKSGNKMLSQSARVLAKRDIHTGRLFVYQAILDRKPPSEVIKEMFVLHELHDFALMGYEENLFRDLFKEALKNEALAFEKKHGYKSEALDTMKSVWADQKKERRIYGIEPAIASGNIVFKKGLDSEFVHQLNEYPHCNRNDGLDALEILHKITKMKKLVERSRFKIDY